jgi:alkylhydroperoxidase/carboxymuconolactone decarboxylase family protein YurZ
MRSKMAKAAKSPGPVAVAKTSGRKKTTKQATTPQRDDRWVFPFEAEIHEVAPGLLGAQNAWLSQIDSLPAPDRKTHELIRMVCSVVARNPLGIRRHAMLAAEVGATWEEVAGSVILAGPAFGILVVVEAFPWARKGWERGSSLEDEEE